jgi:hypothetical protein
MAIVDSAAKNVGDSYLYCMLTYIPLAMFESGMQIGKQSHL